jgi:hypothetical protein
VAVGIGVGSHTVGHALLASMATEPGSIALQVDWQNAFNTMRRDEMQATAEQCLLQWLAQLPRALVP